MKCFDETRNKIIESNPLVELVQSYGIKLDKRGNDMVGLCPFHDESSPSFTVTPSKNVFHCFGCGQGGSVIDFVSKKEGITIGQAMQKLSGKTMEEKPKDTRPKKEICRYAYTDETGNILYKVVRYEPKDFRQCQAGKDGKTVWSMDGVRRVLYNLPKVLKASTVWIVEGEKDVDNLTRLCQVATCNVGGAGKWMDGYTEHLKDKNVIICPDNDEAGKRHLDVVMKSLAGKVKSVCVVKVPEPNKDISDFISSFDSDEKACGAILALVDAQPKLTAGIDLPIYSMEELETEYIEYAENIDKCKLDLSAWLPAFRGRIRGLVPGETMSILADTGTGKTAILQNIAYHAAPLTVLIFSIELPSTLVFERFVQIGNEISGQQIEDSFKKKETIDWRTKGRLNHIFTCPLSKVTPELIEELIVKSELKIGKKPDVVMIDYIGLIKSTGKSRYEIVSTVAEEIKRIAKSTKTIIIMASQIHRKGNESTKEINLHDAKDSGSVENSSGLAIGAWREDADKMTIKVLKGTKGGGGFIVPCEFHGETLRIWQQH